MIRSGATILAAAVSLCAGAAPLRAQAPAGLSDVDRDLARAESMTAELGRSVAVLLASAAVTSDELRARCESGFSIERTAADLAAGQTPMFKWMLERDWEAYFKFKAYVTRDSEQCVHLKWFFYGKGSWIYDQKSKEIECRTDRTEYRFIRAWAAHSADLDEICPRFLLDTYGKRITPDGARAACAIWKQTPGDEVEVCSRFQGLVRGFGRKDRPGCRAYVRSLNGDVGVCTNLRKGSRDTCLGVALFSRAYRAQDAALCGRSEACRLLMGGGEELIQAHYRKIRDFICAERARAKRPTVQEAVDRLYAGTGEIQRLLDSAQRRLEQADQAVLAYDPAALESIDRRGEALARLRERVSAMASSVPQPRGGGGPG